MTSLDPRFLTQAPLSGSQVVNLLHSGYNVSSNNSTTGQNLTITKIPENPDIIPSISNTQNPIPLLLLVGGLLLLAIVLK